MVIEDNPVPTPTNPLGVKGAGPIALEFRDAEKVFDPQAVYGERKSR